MFTNFDVFTLRMLCSQIVINASARREAEWKKRIATFKATRSWIELLCCKTRKEFTDEQCKLQIRRERTCNFETYQLHELLASRVVRAITLGLTPELTSDETNLLIDSPEYTAFILKQNQLAAQYSEQEKKNAAGESMPTASKPGRP